MLYPYVVLPDEIEVQHTHLLDSGKVEVHFEQPTDMGFNSARCELPSYTWIIKEGFTQEVLQEFEAFLRNNAHSILVKAWDPDFTKVTPEEERRMAAAERSGFVNETDID